MSRTVGTRATLPDVGQPSDAGKPSMGVAGWRAMANTPTSLRLRVADDVTLAADAYGDPDDRPVVLLHGGGQTRHAWDHTAEQLAARRQPRAQRRPARPRRQRLVARRRLHLPSLRRRRRAPSPASCPRPPALVGASLGGIASLLAVGEAPADDAVASALVLVDVAPRIEQQGVDRIRAFMRQGLDGFASLEEAADAIAALQPAPAPAEGPLRADEEPPPARRRPLVLALGPVVHGARRARHRQPDRRHAPAPAASPRRARGGRRPGDDPDAARARRRQRPAQRGGRRSTCSPLIPHAELVNVAGAGHMVAGDRNDNFNAAVIEFLAAN